MVYLRVKVNCFRCNNDFERTEVRTIRSISQTPRYECFPCFKKNRTGSFMVQPPKDPKKDFHCLRCKYKFKAHRPMCPYCSRNDAIVKGDITVHDLL